MVAQASWGGRDDSDQSESVGPQAQGHCLKWLLGFPVCSPRNDWSSGVRWGRSASLLGSSSAPSLGNDCGLAMLTAGKRVQNGASGTLDH
ncbi:MAG: hypothetical protein FRX49_09329 [Trebouxia sp. A1-2]|nr:MAG: hypothetical protein FRX49_09329 [Trebouxia sp. A1-2]